MGGRFEVTHFDGEHTPSVYTSLSDALTEFSSKISEVLSDSSISMVGKFDSSMEADEVRQNFIASRTFFVFDQTGAVPEMRGQDLPVQFRRGTALRYRAFLLTGNHIG